MMNWSRTVPLYHEHGLLATVVHDVKSAVCVTLSDIASDILSDIASDMLYEKLAPCAKIGLL